MKIGFIFPGQGAQYVGMMKELLDNYQEVRDTFAAADEALGFSLTKLCLEGPEEDLKLTYHTQPALLTAGVAAYRALTSRIQVEGSIAAGHSLGEYTALVIAGALSFEEAVKVVYQRGRFMDAAVPAGEGAMAAVLGIDRELLQSVCEEISESGDLVDVANLNCPGQIVISGSKVGVERASTLARDRGAKRAIPLVVSGPFHSRLMEPASNQLGALLDQTTFTHALLPVMTNVDATPVTEPDEIRDALKRQLYSSVRWEDDVVQMQSLGVDTFIEFGPGTVLSGLIRKIDRRISTFHVENEESLAEVISAIQV